MSYSFIVLTISILVSCASTETSSGLVVEGTVTNAAEMTVFLDKAFPSKATEVITQTQSDNSGAFTIALEEKPVPGLYRLRVGSNSGALVLTGEESKIEIAPVNMKDLGQNKFEVTGSAATSEVNQVLAQYTSRKLNMQGITDFINDAEYPLAASQFALMVMSGRPDFASLHRTAYDRTLEKYGNNDFTQSYVNYVAAMENAYAKKQASEKIKVGMPAPDIALPDPDGEVKTLSSLQGQVVLLDFWASWCGPCRRANPHVVETYHKYKDQEFTVFSVSLDGLDSRTRARFGNDADKIQVQVDAQKKRWLAAIKQDKLEWDSHVSELAKWDTKAAKMYGVTGIPKTFLIDRDGKIAAINPRYNLEEALQKVL